jgi:hypothetical protein
MRITRFDAADPAKFVAAAEVAISRDHAGLVYYGITVEIDEARHGIVASMKNHDYSRDDLVGILAMHWQMLAEDGHIGNGTPLPDWHANLITLTGDPLQDHLQVAYAAGTQKH